MARNRRRVTRGNAQKSPEPSQDSERSSEVPNGEAGADSVPSRSDDDRCPACKIDRDDKMDPLEKESWIRCDACKTWYHWLCTGTGGDVEVIDKWFCNPCLKDKPARTITIKPPARKSARKRTQRDYANLNSGLESDPNRWTLMLQGKQILEDRFKRMDGSEVGLEWLESDETAMREPIVVEKPDGLGMKMPDGDFSVDDVADIVGRDTPVEVIDVASQANCPGWTLERWAEYYNLEPSARDKIRNVISLEISGTKLADQVLPPRVVRELDWVERFWPSAKKGRGHPYPKVQLYCLMGVASAWTDWHVDFAGSSVYYHILRGSKVFYFIRPTPENLAAYERWSGTEIQNHSWLGDMVDEVVKVTLYEGNTMIIPTGWIHAVYTPVDSLVFGGNFLHSYNVGIQLKICEIETSTHVPKKFRFPMFTKLCWYVGEKYLRDLKAKEEFSPRILQSLEELADYLVYETRMMERGSEHSKREAKEQVPSDRVKDPAAMARELRWRVRLALGSTSDDEDSSPKTTKSSAGGHASNGVNGVSVKRKRQEVGNGVEHASQFMNYQPRAWDVVKQVPSQNEERVIKARKPDDEETWKRQWVEWDDGWLDADDGEQVAIQRRRDVIIKVRKTDQGVERQRIERVVEKWTWNDGSSTLSIPEGPQDDRDEVKMEDDKAVEVAVENLDVPMADVKAEDKGLEGEGGPAMADTQILVGS